MTGSSFLQIEILRISSAALQALKRTARPRARTKHSVRSAALVKSEWFLNGRMNPQVRAGSQKTDFGAVSFIYPQLDEPRV